MFQAQRIGAEHGVGFGRVPDGCGLPRRRPTNEAEDVLPPDRKSHVDAGGRADVRKYFILQALLPVLRVQRAGRRRQGGARGGLLLRRHW